MTANSKTKVKIYTDGACSGNPGIGGFACILLAQGKEKVIYDYRENTTNNQMELMAVIAGLACLKRPCQVDVFSDSAYVVNAFLQKWLEKWKKNGFKNASNQEVSNKELWQKLDQLVSFHEVIFHKVKGHDNNELNNRCDKLAVTAYRERIKQL